MLPLGNDSSHPPGFGMCFSFHMDSFPVGERGRSYLMGKQSGISKSFFRIPKFTG